jgi:hypothetical protein
MPERHIIVERQMAAPTGSVWVLTATFNDMLAAIESAGLEGGER